MHLYFDLIDLLALFGVYAGIIFTCYEEQRRKMNRGHLSLFQF